MHSSSSEQALGARDAGVAAASGLSILAEGPGYEGYVVVDTVVGGTSAGGVRIASDLPLDEVRELAREMSLKYALFHLPRGGAKAGVRLQEGLDAGARLAALRDFGRKLAPVIRQGIYYPGMDMNCGPIELRAIYQGAGIELGEVTDTSWFTAISVFHALQACRARLNVTGRPLTLAIEGFGSVARHLAARLDPVEFEIAAVATIEGAVWAHEPWRPADLVSRKDAAGDAFVHELAGDRIDRDAVLTSAVDLLLPSSRTWVLTAAIARAVKARAVVPISNAPYGAGAVEILAQRSVTCLPGYLSNVGGVLASSLYDQGVSRPEVEAIFASEYRPIVDGVLDLAARHGVPATEIAAGLARRHMAQREAFPHRPLVRRLYDRFVRPKLPSSLRTGAARRTMVARMSSLREEIARGELTA